MLITNYYKPKPQNTFAFNKAALPLIITLIVKKKPHYINSKKNHGHIKQGFGQYSQECGVILEAVLCRARSWIEDPCGPLPAQHIL